MVLGIISIHIDQVVLLTLDHASDEQLKSFNVLSLNVQAVSHDDHIVWSNCRKRTLCAQYATYM